MTENDQKKMNNSNFDKEFSLNREKKTRKNGKFPSWIMILAGVAVIAGVVAAKQPVIRPGTGTRASVNAPAATLTVSAAFYNGMNDQQAAPSELEARFTSHTEGSSVSKNAQFFMTSDEQVFSLEMEELTVDENGDVLPEEENDGASVYWMDEKPYALKIKPAEETGDSSSENVSTVYTIDDREYDVHLDAVSEDEIASMPEDELKNIVRVGDSSYRLDLVPSEKSEQKAAVSGTGAEDKTETTEPVNDAGSTENPAAETPEADKPAPVEEKAASDEKPAVPEKKAEKSDIPEDAAVAWLNDKPYAVTVKPYQEKTAQETKSGAPVPAAETAVPADVKSNNTAADSPADEKQTSKPVTSVNIGEEPDDELTDKAAAEETGAADMIDPETEAAIMAGAGRFDVLEDQTEQVLPINEEQHKGISDKTAVNVPVTMLDEVKEQNVQTAVFEADGKQYEIRVTELDPEKAPEKDPAQQPVIWMDTVPLAVTLQPESAADNSENKADSADVPFDIVLNPVPEEEVPALYEERFGVPYEAEKEDSTAETEAETPAVQSEATVEPTEEPAQENWFVSVFHNIFGSGPTATPTPQVTVIAVSPTPAPAKPTATPIVVQFVPTAAPQSPVRLDGSEQKAGTQKDAADTNYSDWDDNALWDDPNDSLSVEQRRATVTAVSQGIRTTPSATPRPATATPTPYSQANKVQIIMVDPDDENWPTLMPTSETEPKELPETGIAEGWNIPSMLAMLAGLLLIIIGVRRLRKSSQQ